jgi:hypothetical protein
MTYGRVNIIEKNKKFQKIIRMYNVTGQIDSIAFDTIDSFIFSKSSNEAMCEQSVSKIF